MAWTSAEKPVVVGQGTGTTSGKPGDLPRHSAALDPGDGGDSAMADSSRVTCLSAVDPWTRFSCLTVL